MQMEPLKELLQDIEQEMRRLGYTEGSLNFYRNRWRMLTKFAEEEGKIFFSERLGIDFIEKHFHILEKDFDGTLTQAQVQNLRIIRMIGDFQLHHTVLRRYYKHKEILTDPYLIGINGRFNQYCIEKGYSSVTIDHYVKQAARFLDYAIILLACRLGLRCTDIKNLTMDNFHWEDKKLVFVQSKSRATLSLPLTPEVGWAVIDYLKYGRPNVQSHRVFVRHIAPFLPFSEGNHLKQIITKYIRRAHLPTLKKKTGMHSLRHTLASMLLENDTPLPTISDILGHIDTESIAVYLKVDIKKLKECSLDLVEDMS